MLMEKKTYGVRKTLNFMLKVVWQQRPALYLVYLVQLVADCMQKAQLVLLPKFLMDELTMLAKGTAVEVHIRNAAVYAGLTVGIMLLSNVLNSFAAWKKEPHRVWMNSYFEEVLSDHTMGMDFEYTEDPEALDQVAKAKDGISWYSGGAVGILDKFYTVVMNIVVLCGVVSVIALNCPVLLPVQLLANSFPSPFYKCR